MFSAFNSFSRIFTAVYEPVTPICVLNPQTVSSGLPAGWALSTGAVNFANEGTRKYCRFPMTPGATVADRIQYSIPSTPINYGTNGGMTYILVVRMNSTNALYGSPGNIPVSMVSPQGISGMQNITPSYNGGACVFGAPANGYVYPSPTIMIGKNKFHFIAHTVNNSTSQIVNYFEGKRYGALSTTNLTNITSTATAFFTIKTTWGFGLTTGIDYDMLYFAHYDRPLSENDIKRVYNSIAPLMGNTVSPLFTTATPFSSLNRPSSPLFEFNAFNYTQTNGQSYAAGTSGWVANTVQNLYWGVDGLGRRYLNFNQNFAGISKDYTVNSSMYTNQGYTVAMILRVNSFTNGGQNCLFSSGLANFYLNNQYTASSAGGALVSDNFNYLCAVSSIGGQTDANTVYLAPTSFSLNKFMLVCYVVSGSTASVYINNVRMSQRTIPTLTGGNATGLATSATLGLSHNNAGLGVVPLDSVDFMYASFYDRALTTTEMTTLFNSCSMLLDV
jgi:hypothetical protein